MEAKSGLIELSDSDDSDSDSDAELVVAPAATTAALVAAITMTGESAAMLTAKVTTAVSASTPAVVTPQENPAKLRLAKLERQRALAAERERQELEQRKLRFLAASKAPKNARQALLISLRQKVQQTAKENYCSAKKINTEHLALKLKIAEKCRLVSRRCPTHCTICSNLSVRGI
jgi:endonuclease/exonuclease/phosphatase (EEP) superfamily protein YafD